MPEEKKRKVKRSLIIGSTGLALTGLGLASLAKAKSNKSYYVTEVIPPFEGKDHSESNPTPEEAKAEKKRKIKKSLKIAGGVALGAGALAGAGLAGSYITDRKIAKKLRSTSLGSGNGDLLRKYRVPKALDRIDYRNDFKSWLGSSGTFNIKTF